LSWTPERSANWIGRSTSPRFATRRVVGYFAPTLDPADYEGVDSPASEEELDRRSRAGDGRTLAEIMTDLRSYPLD
jgi:hypothetical protein